jgi:hypothetical protein
MRLGNQPNATASIVWLKGARRRRRDLTGVPPRDTETALGSRPTRCGRVVNPLESGPTGGPGIGRTTRLDRLQPKHRRADSGRFWNRPAAVVQISIFNPEAFARASQLHAFCPTPPPGAPRQIRSRTHSETGVYQDLSGCFTEALLATGIRISTDTVHRRSVSQAGRHGFEPVSRSMFSTTY